ncbi:hypothetical protein [Psychromonas aquimarina]|uniref:hypothetical protein n=1 Tax=Psychromonas aquimarina TaxID=444919 RepID=UPI000417FBF5|nr:hypothetical protein [Psychromonas aquimarina]
MSRWYDKHPNLKKQLDEFKEMHQKVREPIIKEIIDLVKKHDLSLLSYEKAFEFPFDCNRRRWYDNDPHLWLMFNILEVADEALLHSVEDYLENRAKVVA